MAETVASIGQVKRDISELVNRVAYGGDRILLTSRGKPKAALISIEDYERLKRQEHEVRAADWREWMRRAKELSDAIYERRGGEYIDVDELDREVKRDLEERDEYRITQ
jgi:prevent-host-death family protein